MSNYTFNIQFFYINIFQIVLNQINHIYPYSILHPILKLFSVLTFAENQKMCLLPRTDTINGSLIDWIVILSDF